MSPTRLDRTPLANIYPGIVIFMPRRSADEEDWRRAEQLGEALTQRKDDAGLAVQAIADRCGLGYETVRALLAARSAGPSFFLIADLADALAVSLDDLAEESR